VRVPKLASIILLICFLYTADRAPLPPRDDVPLPTNPPYTAFVGNLAFDMSDMELEEFFAPHKVRAPLFVTDL
jgi:translation initiation factor 4B